MDFFEHQEKARRNSHLLIFYFVLAVLGIILAIYGLVLGISFFLGNHADPLSGGGIDLWDPSLLASTSLGAGGVIFLASAFKTMQLSGGGKVVARELGGRRLDRHTTEFHERRLLNIVEEMAIASGVPVPEVYVMDGEDSINAFAAGKTPSDAVIGVTRGCMKLLTRDELQGVMAHEFSHILNGDMRLNMRLIGLLFGILFLTLIGELIVRSFYYSGRASRSRESGGVILALLLAGVGLIIIGYVGSFFAGLIKASLSRQREYLADASAVQFTRNPDGIAGALKKIGALNSGSQIAHPMARDTSHLFFGSAFRSDIFATHPPLSDRIRRLIPTWNGDFGTVKLAPITQREELDVKERTGTTGTALTGMLFSEGRTPIRLTEEEAAESMRSPHLEQVTLGQHMLAAMPESWLKAVREEEGAQAIIFALLLGQDEKLREQELQWLRQGVDPLTFQQTVTFYQEMSGLHSAVKLALVDLSIPTLRRLSPDEYQRFRAIMEALVKSDQMVHLFEFTLQNVVARHLDTYFGITPPPRIRYRQLNQLREDASILISTLAAFGSPSTPESVEASFRSGCAHFEDAGGGVIEFKEASQCGLNEIRGAIQRFSQSTPLMKRELLLACSKVALNDGTLSSLEAELIRAIADAIGTAIPPFVRTARLEDV